MLLKVQAVDEQREKTCSYGDRRRVFENAAGRWISFPCMKDMGGGIDAICKKRAEYFEFRVRKENMIDGMEFCLQLQTDRYEPVFRNGDVIALTEKKQVKMK